MRTIRMLSSAVLVGSMALFAPGGASAAPSTTYTGTFDGRITYEGCTPNVAKARTSGEWTMALHGTSAKGTFNILVNGQPHVSYVFPMMKQSPIGPDYAFSVYGVTQAGLLTVTLTNDGEMTYVIAPYGLDGVTCDSVTYPGRAT